MLQKPTVTLEQFDCVASGCVVAPSVLFELNNMLLGCSIWCWDQTKLNLGDIELIRGHSNTNVRCGKAIIFFCFRFDFCALLYALSSNGITRSIQHFVYAKWFTSTNIHYPSSPTPRIAPNDLSITAKIALAGKTNNDNGAFDIYLYILQLRI